MGHFVEDMEGYVRETPAEAARPISVFDMQPAKPVQPVEPVQPAAKKAADEGSKK